MGIYDTPPAIGTFVLAAALTAGFLVHLRHHPDPAISPRLFRVQPFRVASIAIFVYYLGFAAALLAASLFLTGVWHYSVLRAGLGIVPGPVASAAVAPFSGRISARIGPPITALIGGVLFAAGCSWWLTTATTAPHFATVFMPGIVIWGCGNGLIQPTMFHAADSLPGNDLTVGSAVLTTARQLGLTIGVAILLALLNGRDSLGAFQHAWIYIIATALLAGLIGSRLQTAHPAVAATPQQHAPEPGRDHDQHPPGPLQRGQDLAR